ncbi:MAG: ABC transporter ATP-binding protein, partial [bacterium]|nr:ABC transporter ATP-binding protein [bacterium]
DLRSQMGTAVILITHDLGVVAETADRVAVMYAGQIVEQASVTEIFEQPLHPYTIGLINSIPVLGEVKDRLDVIDGVVPNLVDLPPGCRFAPRCRASTEICLEKTPNLKPAQKDHTVRCWLFHDSDGNTISRTHESETLTNSEKGIN